MSIIAERLRELKGAMSGNEFADSIGIPPQTVGFWLRGARSPSAENVARIARKWHISADWLLGLAPTWERGDFEQYRAGYEKGQAETKEAVTKALEALR